MAENVVPFPPPREPVRAIDRAITVTRFPDKYAQTKREVAIPFRRLAAAISKRTAPTKAQLPWLKLASFGEEPSARGSLRTNRNMLAIDGIEIDYDAGAMQPEEAVRRLRKAKLAGLIYTTASNSATQPRWRGFFPTSRSLPTSARQALVARVNGVFGGVLAAESFTASLAFYYGRIEGADDPVVGLVDGRAIDQAHELDAGALGRDGKAYHQPDSGEDDIFSDVICEELPDWVKPALDAIPSSARDDYLDWLEIGMALHHGSAGSIEGLELFDEWSQRSSFYNYQELETKWESFGSYKGKPVSLGTVYYEARKHGWKPPRRYTGESRLQFLSPQECAVAAPRGYVVKRLIAPGDLFCVFGPPGAGKSALSPFVGYSVAQGEPVFDMRTKRGVVFYVAAEDGHGMANRVAALRKRLGEAPDFQLVIGTADLFAEDSADREALLDAIEAERPVLVFLDTLAMAFPGLDENEGKEMMRVVAIARSFSEHGAAVGLIHHNAKDGDSPRGFGGLNGNLDMAMLLMPADDSGIVRARLSKNRNGPCDLDIAFRIDAEELGVDEDGDAITAAIAFPLPSGSATRVVKLPPAQQAAFDILERLRADGEVTEAQWREACIDSRNVSASETRTLRKDAFNRVYRELARKNLVFVNDGVVSPHGEVNFD